jgi:hypothetical protein
MTAKTTPSILLVCMLCRRETENNIAKGEPLRPAHNHSHGLCAECAPDYLRTLQFSDGEVQRFMQEHYP